MTERRATSSRDRRRRSGSAEPSGRRAKGGGRRRRTPARAGRGRPAEDGADTGREGAGREGRARTGRGRRGKARPGKGLTGSGRLWGGLGAIAVLGAAGFAAVGWAPADRDESVRVRPTGSAESEPERSRRTSGPGASRAPSASPGTSPSGSADDSAGGSSRGPAGDSDRDSAGGSSRGSSRGPSRGSAGGSPSPSGRTIPESGPGTFTKAPGTGPKVGEGKALRYRVEVEKGLSLSAADVAEEVERILADPRGWTADGDSAFQRVSGGATDFVVKVATPGTVDDICGAFGLDTGGEVNCNVDDNVMVNLKRWELATPVYADDVTAYRALIINHEVGHFLGHGHVGCPGEGEPAPAMMQQIKGMKGCVPNVWPYDAKGRLITGPAVP